MEKTKKRIEPIMKSIGNGLRLCLGLLLFLLLPALLADEIMLNLSEGWGLYSLPLTLDATGEETLLSLKNLWIWDGKNFVYSTSAPKPYTGFILDLICNITKLTCKIWSRASGSHVISMHYKISI